jgi:hypothetical protein
LTSKASPDILRKHITDEDAMPTILTIDLDRVTLGSGYFLHSTVVSADPLKTNPAELEPSLLVRLATSTQPDALARVCTRTDLEQYGEPIPPNILGLYELAGNTIQGDIASINVGNTVTITCPDIWTYLGYGAAFVTTVSAISFLGDSILVATPMPSYFANLSYTVSAGMSVKSTGTDAIARRYNLNGDVCVRVKDDVTQFTDLSQAINKLESVRAEAQGLVSDYDRDGTSFEGYSEEGFIPT